MHNDEFSYFSIVLQELPLPGIPTGNSEYFKMFRVKERRIHPTAIHSITPSVQWVKIVFANYEIAIVILLV